MSREFRHIVRVKGTDLDGSKRLLRSLTKIKGVGVSLANAIVRIAGFKPDTRLGYLTEPEVTKIEDMISDPSKYGIPPHLLNRRKDQETGRNLHLTTADLTLKTKMDIDLMKNMKTWRGIRHSLGLKVRGQRTRTTGRKGKAVGVKKKSVVASAREKERRGE
ncbi:MAG: 30S ribosomal protein S13 [Candidatus Bathyarchaeia archaeon]